jgi:CheY-like chemotaxis protein
MVLVVDDDANVRDTIRDLLALEEISARVVSPEEDVIGLLSQLPIRVVVTDLNMPGMDGVDLVERVKKECETLGYDIPVYVLTGAGGEGRLEQARMSGAAGTFPKPFDLDEFTDTLREALGQGKSNP